jgi:hypothetical protein
MLSEEGPMEIMVTMNKLVLELLPKVPDFGLAELQELAVGTHTHNRDCIKQVIVYSSSINSISCKSFLAIVKVSGEQTSMEESYLRLSL